MTFKHAPTGDSHGKKKSDLSQTLRFYRNEQYGPNEVEMFLHGKRPEVCSVKAAGVVHSEQPVVSVKQKATRQVGVIHVDRAKHR